MRKLHDTYAVKYYGLRENPCHKAGSMGKKHASEMKFWTKEEYLTFEKVVEDNLQAHLVFGILYWCGIREGELLALMIGDIDFEGKTISVNKSYQRIGKEDIITEPKTPKSNRVVAIPQFLCDEIKAYIATIYKPTETTRLFPITNTNYGRQWREDAGKAALSESESMI